MTMVTVYSFKRYDINADENPQMPRKATIEAIKACEGDPIEGTAEEVDASRLDGNGFLKPVSEGKP